MESNKELRRKTRDSAIILDKNIVLLDYKNNYNLDGLLKEGVSNIAGLITYVAKLSKYKESDFTIGTAKGGGCSAFNAFTPDGDYIMGRNFDFKTAPCLVIWTHPEGNYSSLAVVDNNFITYGNKHNVFNGRHTAQLLLSPYCCVDGINEKGLSIAVLQIRAKATKQTDPAKKDITTTAMVRAVLDTCANVDEAVELFKKYNMHDSLYCCYHYFISDSTGRTVIVEFIDNKINVYEKNSDKYTVKNSVFENDGQKLTYMTNYTITKDIGSFKVEQHGYDRTDAIKNAFTQKQDVMTELEAMDLLSHVKLDYDHPKYPWRIEALWSAVYNTTKCTMKIAAGMDYKKVYTFSVEEPCKVLDTESIDKSEYPAVEWDYL
ncbi:MAG: linear amide C-N hydrolase [Clostridia bacterium]|nr:linear amide C-N hydrolase [Clostridia bacterium]